MIRELEPMYDTLFEDEELRKLFLNVHNKYWSKLNIKEKVDLVKQINEKVASLYGYRTPIIKLNKVATYGAYSSFYWEIFINPDSLKNDNGYEVIDTYFHELRHSYQKRCVENELTDKETYDENLKKLWARNQIPGNYFDGDSSYYKWQPTERDAWSTGVLFARKIYMLNKKVISEKDPTWETYCQAHKDVIMNFISASEESKEYIAAAQKEIDEIYDARSSDLEQIELAKEYIEKLAKNSNIDELSYEEIGILLSKYCYRQLDISNKVKVWKRYYDLTKVDNNSYKIEENTIDSIKCGKRTVFASNALAIVNILLTENFIKIVNAIVNDKKIGYSLSEEATREIKLNMYKDENKKKINYIGDNENLFLFSLQPYARYESGYVLDEFKRLKDIELKYFKKNSNVWAYWENFYDNSLIYKTAEDLMGMSIEEYYASLLKTYEDRIANKR